MKKNHRTSSKRAHRNTLSSSVKEVKGAGIDHPVHFMVSKGAEVDRNDDHGGSNTTFWSPFTISKRADTKTMISFVQEKGAESIYDTVSVNKGASQEAGSLNQQAFGLIVENPTIIDQTEGDTELERFEQKDRFGENTEFRTTTQ